MKKIKILFTTAALCVLAFPVIAQKLVNTGKTQQAVAPAQPDDLCTAINKVMKFSFDKFESIKEAEKQVKIGLYSEYSWMSKYQVPGFIDSKIKVTVTEKNYFTATYYNDWDTQTGVEKYNELIEKVKACVPRACCEFTPSVSKDMPDMKRFEFWTDKVKPGSDKRLYDVYIVVSYLIETDTKHAVVTLNISPKE
ncbi:MAG: hypothetical protein HYU69_00890 [Bacteroidetes bacterium]|nr:hypothetical protein [Bacteroidota bacterium]